MAVTSVLVLWLMRLSVGAGNTTIFFENFTFLCRYGLYAVRVITPENTVTIARLFLTRFSMGGDADLIF